MRCVLYKELPSNRTFGVELEVSDTLTKKELGKSIKEFEEFNGWGREVVVTSGTHGWAKTTSNDYWHVKYDSTCGPNGKGTDFGWEIASFIGRGAADIHHIADCASFLHRSGAQTNKNCGLHVHVGTQDFSIATMSGLLASWLKIEHALLAICETHRSANEYCRPLRTRMNRLVFLPFPSSYLWYCLEPTDLGDHNNYEKRYTLNTIGFATAIVRPSYSRNTVELRMPECTLENHHVGNWIKLIVNFVESAKDASRTPEDVEPARSLDAILYYLGLAGGRDEFFILDPELFGLKLWFLNKLSTSHDDDLAIQAKKKLEFIGRF